MIPKKLYYTCSVRLVVKIINEREERSYNAKGEINTLEEKISTSWGG